MNSNLARSYRHPVVAGVVGLVLFFVVAKLLAAPLAGWLGLDSFGTQLALKLVLLAVVFALIATSRRPRADFGLQASGGSWRDLGVGGLLLGILATAIITVSPAEGMANLSSFGLVELIIAVWIVSSVSEEFLCRGLVYGWMLPNERNALGLPVPVLVTAVLFGSMHLTLLLTPTDHWTTAVVLASTTALGVLCGLARHRTGSLWPAIWVHMLFNVGGFVGGPLMVLLGLVELPPR